jgi:hypothetical protein
VADVALEQTIFQDKVTCGAWTFNDPLTLPAGVTALGANVLNGWDDRPPIDVLMSSRGTRDGDVPADRFPFRSRPLTFGGWLYCVDRTAAINARTALARDVFPRNVDLTFVRHEPDAAKQMMVRAADIEYPPMMNVTGPHFRFLVTLRAFDPLKYATTVDISGSVGVSGTSSGGRTYPALYPKVYAAAAGQSNVLTLVNLGGHETRPVTTITGPLPAGWRWVNETSGQFIGLNVTLEEGANVTLDHQRELVLVNGVQIAPAITGDWWGLLPGSNALRLFGEFNASAQATVSGRSAWE